VLYSAVDLAFKLERLDRRCCVNFVLALAFHELHDLLELLMSSIPTSSVSFIISETSQEEKEGAKDVQIQDADDTKNDKYIEEEKNIGKENQDEKRA
ncbi:hypothetical protein Lal_00039212, partial [Lupinus albus]